MTEPEAFTRMRSLDDTERYSYAERGKICLEIEKSMKHRERIDPETGEPCSLSSWIRLSAPWGYAQCWAALRDVKALSDIPMEHLAKVPESNIGVLKQLSTAVRSQPAVLEAAKTKRSDEFIDHIKRYHRDQHIETKTTLRFVADESQEYEIEKAIATAMKRGARNRTEALCDIAINYSADVLIEELQKQ